MSSEINLKGIFLEHIGKLKEFKIAIICDDSTSMTECLSYGQKQRRWDELKDTVTVILSVLSEKGHKTEVRFLNNVSKNFICEPKTPITREKVDDHFPAQPLGATPLTEAFKLVLDKYKDQKLLVIIFTDGHPTERGKNEAAAIYNFRTALETKSKETHVTIVACTDEKATMKYLCGWDEDIDNLDVLDDYLSEKRCVEEAGIKGQAVQFDFNDYIGKILLGSLVAEIDALDGFYAKK